MSNVTKWTTRSAETAEQWGEGPWKWEPDKIQWVDDATGLDCLMHRQPNSGHWCGYVGVSEGHPYFGIGYSDCTKTPPCEESYCGHSPDVDVHGGLTYAEFCQDTDDESRGICHVPLPGRPHKVWWLGFDCWHSGDLAPNDRNDAPSSWRSGTYKTRRYVENECTSLARQIGAVGCAK